MVRINANALPNLRIAMILPGLGRVHRGAETAFLQLARYLSEEPNTEVTLFGSGSDVPKGLTIEEVPCRARERFEGWPTGPFLRNEYCYEELTFILRMIASRRFNPLAFDVALHCSFPFTNWMLRQNRSRGVKSVFVTQNGDWMCRALNREYRSFRCDGLICTNPEYFARHNKKYNATLIPNGVDPDEFRPRLPWETREKLAPEGYKAVLMTSALIASKRVNDAINAVARVPSAYLVVAGDGPERGRLQFLAQQKLPGRHRFLGSLPRDQMPTLYRAADAFLHTSQDEPFGIAYLEAAASGLPIVAHESRVPRWILGDAAFFADTGDEAALARGIAKSISPHNAIRGLVARDRIARDWTWAEQAKKYRTFLQSVVTGTPATEELACSQS